MSLDELAALFEKHENEYLEFKPMPPQRLCERRDLCAFILLHQLVPGTNDMVSAGEHDQIWLDVSAEALAAVAMEDDVLTLIRCGVMYDEETDSLSMFV